MLTINKNKNKNKNNNNTSPLLLDAIAQLTQVWSYHKGPHMIMKKEGGNGVVAAAPSPAGGGGGSRGKTSKDPPAKYELESSSRSSSRTTRKTTQGKSTTTFTSMASSSYHVNRTTSAALNLIQEALDEDDDLNTQKATVRLVSTAPLLEEESISINNSSSNNKTPGKLSVASAYSNGHDSVSSPRSSNDHLQPSSSIARDFKRMQEGFRVKAFFNSYPEHAVLHLDKQRKNICISTSNGDEEKKDGSDSERCLKIPMNQVFKLEFGRTGQAGTRLHPLKSFSIAIENGPALFYYDFEAETPLERDYLVSTLIHVLEAIYHQNEIRQDALTVRGNTRGYENERRDVDDVIVEYSSYSSIDGPLEAAKANRRETFLEVLVDDVDEEGGTVDQPIPCSPSLEMSHNDFVVEPSSLFGKGSDDARPSMFGFSMFDAQPGKPGRDSYESRDQQDWTNHGQRGAQGHDTFGKNYTSNFGFRSQEDDDDEEERLDYNAADIDPIEERSRALLRSLLAKTPVFNNDRRNKTAFSSLADPNSTPRARLNGQYGDEPIDLIAGNGTVDLITPNLAPAPHTLDDHYSPPLLVPGQLVAVEKASSNAEGSGRNSFTRRKQEHRGWMTSRNTNSFSENSTVAASNVRKSRSNSMPQNMYAGSSPSEPIVVEEGLNGQVLEHRDGALDDNQSQTTNDTDMADVQGQGIFLSSFQSKTFFDFSGRPTQSYDLRTSSSQHQLVGPWCSDDVCTTTFNDMAQTCSGIFATEPQNQLSQGQPSCINPAILADDQIAVVQEYVNNALGAPSAMYEFFVEDPVPEKSPRDGQKSHGPSNNRVKNRAGVRNAQAGRYRDLRKEMTFASALQSSRQHMQIRTTRSFNDAPPQRITNQAANQFLGSALLSSVVKTMVQQDAELVMEDDDEGVAYYDSDPEDSRERTLHQGPRRVSAQMRNLQDSNGNHNAERSPPPGLGKIRNKLSRKVDEALVKEVVQVMQNDRLTLMWHPTQTRDQPNRAPALVRLWIESGLQLIDGSFLLPKLTWTKINDGNKSAFKSGELHKLDLLDITRIRATEKIDREMHPFASRRVSFIIESQSEVYLFEAETAQERERVVYGLKVVVARLASLLMLRDYRAAEEFFGAPSNMVPGESPF